MTDPMPRIQYLSASEMAKRCKEALRSADVTYADAADELDISRAAVGLACNHYPARGDARDQATRRRILERYDNAEVGAPHWPVCDA